MWSTAGASSPSKGNVVRDGNVVALKGQCGPRRERRRPQRAMWSTTGASSSSKGNVVHGGDVVVLKGQCGPRRERRRPQRAMWSTTGASSSSQTSVVRDGDVVVLTDQCGPRRGRRRPHRPVWSATGTSSSSLPKQDRGRAQRCRTAQFSSCHTTTAVLWLPPTRQTSSSYSSPQQTHPPVPPRSSYVP